VKKFPVEAMGLSQSGTLGESKRPDGWKAIRSFTLNFSLNDWRGGNLSIYTTQTQPVWEMGCVLISA
jgi:hypothetical protein